MNSRALASAALLTCASVAFTACGSSTSAPAVDVAANYAKTPTTQVVSDAKSAMSGLKSFHLTTHKSSGKDAGDADLVVSASGCHLTVAQQPAGHLEVIGVGTTMYVKGDAAFWTANANASAATLFAGRWTTSATYASSFGSKCSVSGMVDDLFSADNFKTPAVGAASKTSDGKPAITLTYVDKDNAHNTVLVLATAPHLVVSGTADDASSFTVSDVNADVTFTAPSDVLNIDTLH